MAGLLGLMSAGGGGGEEEEEGEGENISESTVYGKHEIYDLCREPIYTFSLQYKVGYLEICLNAAIGSYIHLTRNLCFKDSAEICNHFQK